MSDEIENLAKAMEQNASELRQHVLLKEEKYEALLSLTHETCHIINHLSDDEWPPEDSVCPDCKGSGLLEVATNQEHQCPRCAGSGQP